jgi:hypothetical protein
VEAVIRRKLAWGAGWALLALVVAPTAHARGLEIGFADPLYASAAPQTRAVWLDRTLDASAQLVRIHLPWSAVAGPNPPASPSNPADPSYNFTLTDGAVQDASARGLNVLLTVGRAPTWAEGSGRPASAPPGSWKPDAEAFAGFARAVATRYSGSFDPPGLTPLLPRVKYFQAWNEPNLDTYLTPQWNGRKASSPARYRRLLNAFYPEVKTVHPDNVVVSAGTAPYGSRRGGARMKPLKFWRSLLCLKKRHGKLKPRRRCSDPARLDVLAHHPITGNPRRRARHHGDATIPELRVIRRMLRKAERAGKVLPPGRRPLWVTELWWETNPPETFTKVSLRRQARWIDDALYLIWKQRFSAAILLQVRDDPYEPGDPFATLQSGVFFVDGSPKPSFKAVRFPFVTERRSPRHLTAWGKSPLSGALTIERKRHGKWHPLRRLQGTASGVFKTTVRVRGPAKLRARVGGVASLRWRQKH